ncbi:uncharacterized protein FIBRA_02548 [Fibroporia radiculosa]|uniref:Uncharacterized protein n=1 Tax=Fibroporia radiculosa TaxID=599839 RepID=J4H1X1_9APHY|nr:uncharacterized protein FIBRA_02548 [Fibroporia radiculosa]CCM00514.1 predicted protein [Fibroporia radiculosa]
MLDNERLYVDLLFRASKKYANWDPEVVVEVGDWGRITKGRPGLAFWRRKRGTFLKEGNIYKDGKAEKYGIPPPQEHGGDASEGETWISSQNAHQIDVSVTGVGQTPVLAQCSVKSAFKFSSGRGAVLVMQKDTIFTLDPPGSLRQLLEDESMRGLVVVSEVHRCSSYARLLTAGANESVAIGLSVSSPISTAASADAEVKWIRNTNTGNFKSRINKSGERQYYPLFRLVSIKEEDVSTGLRGELDIPPLPDAMPPWMTENDASDSQADA